MVGITDWFNVYTGLRDAVNGLKADLAGMKTDLDGIKNEVLGTTKGGVGNIDDQLVALNTKLTTIEKDFKALADAFGPGELRIGLNIREALSQLNQTHAIISGHLVPSETGGLPGNLSDRLKELAQGAADPNSPVNQAADALLMLSAELTKPGSESIIEGIRKWYSGIGDRLKKEDDQIEAQTQADRERVVGAIAKKGEQAIETAVEEAITVLRPALNVLEAPFNAIVKAALEEFRKGLIDSRPADPSKVTEVAAAAITKAYQFGEAAHLLSFAAELFQPLKQMGFSQLAAALGDLAGFKEISGRISGASIGAAITRPLRWWGNDVFTPEILAVRDLVELVQKRVIETPELDHFLRKHGFADQDRTRLVEAVWREPTIRDLAIAIEDTSVPDDWLLQRVRKAGYEDSDAEQLAESLKQRSLKAARGRVISASLAAVTDGLLDTESYRVILEGLQLRPEEIDLQVRTAEISSRRDTVNTAISTYKRQYINDVIDRNDFVLTLTALGVNPDRVDLIALDADAQRAPKIAREEEAKLKASIREIQTELVPRYRRLFELGVIDEVAYENILIEAGISPQVAAQAVLLDRQKRQIVTSTAQATALERETARLVADTEEALRLQFRKGLLDETQLKNSLLDLGYSDERVRVITEQERARIAPTPGRAISAPAEVHDQVLRDYAIQTALNDFRKGRIEALDLYDELVKQGMDEDEALARVNLEISRLPVPISG